MSIAELIDAKLGIGWTRAGDHVVAHIVTVGPEGQETVATINYTLEQAAEVAMRLIDAMGGKL